MDGRECLGVLVLNWVQRLFVQNTGGVETACRSLELNYQANKTVKLMA